MKNSNNYLLLTAEAARIKVEIPVLDYFFNLEKQGILKYEGKTHKEHFFGFEFQKTGSIAINEKSNLWFDHNSGDGGDIIKAVQVFEKLGFVEAVKKLSSNQEIFSRNIESSNLPEAVKTVKDYFITSKSTNITHPALIKYIEERGLEVSDFAGLIQQIHWTKNDKEGQPKKYFGIGIENINGGHAVRSSIFKGNLNETGISSYCVGKKPAQIKVFEGLFDFASYNRLYPGESYLAIVLNSTANLTSKAIEFIKEKVTSLPSIQDKYSRVQLFLDNDEGGKEGTLKIIASIPEAEDKSSLYSSKGLNDLNDYLLKVVQVNNSLARKR